MHSVGCSDRLRRVSRIFALGLLSLLTVPAAAQSLPESVLKTGDRLRAAFRPVVADARHSSVRILVDGEPAALGVIVSESGHILTKSSQLRGKVTVLLPDEREVAAKKISSDGESDLALIKVAVSTKLRPVAWAEDEPPVGSWLVSVGQERMPVGVGVVSVTGREIAPQRGVLGIYLGDDPDGPMVEDVFPGSGADEAGLERGDVIVSVDGRTVPTRRALLELLSGFRPGDSLPLIVRRGDGQEELLATLGNESTTMVDRQARQNMMAGPLSVRSGGFDLALQHDTVLRPEDCGGPVVDLAGRVVGLNIARAGRVESYALPTAAIRPILAKLMADETWTAKK
ncbi:MAG: trypsin-like peptidase domain-containing protein [Planctomycetaceae bacterium]